LFDARFTAARAASCSRIVPDEPTRDALERPADVRRDADTVARVNVDDLVLGCGGGKTASACRREVGNASALSAAHPEVREPRAPPPVAEPVPHGHILGIV